MSLSSILSTEIVLLDDSDEEQEKDEDMLLACVLVRKYLSEKEKSQFLCYKQNGMGKSYCRANWLALRKTKIQSGDSKVATEKICHWWQCICLL